MSTRLTFLVRRAPNHACVAHVSISDGAMRLLRITADAGPLPDVADLIGKPFSARADLRTEIKSRMRQPETAPIPGADRVRAHAERMQERGLKQVREWIPAEREDEFREIARKIRDREI